MRRFLFLFLLVNPLVRVEAEPCPESSYTLTTQDQVDALGDIGCDEISGVLSLGFYGYGTNSPLDWDITSVSSLSHIRKVGSLAISDTRLTSLEGLNNLRSIDLDLWIVGNHQLTDISALSGISSLGGFLTLATDNFLFDFAGLAGLENIGGAGFLNIVGDPFAPASDAMSAIVQTGGYHPVAASGFGDWSLKQVGAGLVLLGYIPKEIFKGLSGLSEIHTLGLALYVLDSLTGLHNLQIERLILRGVAGLQTLDGLQANTSLRSLFIDGAQSLISLYGFPPVQSVDFVRLERNLVLRDVDALINLEQIQGHLIIGCDGNLESFCPLFGGDGGNPSLLDLDGLANLETVWGDVSIFGNSGLVSISGLANLQSVGNRLAELTPYLAGAAKGNFHLSSNGQLTSCEALAGLIGWPDGPPADNVGGEIILEDNGAGCTSLGTVLDSVSAPLELDKPAAPVITKIETDDGGLQIWVSLPDGGNLGLRSLTATCTDGAQTFSATAESSPVYVGGLENGVAYSCKVAASNVLGQGLGSAYSLPHQPEATLSSMPIWLLYQATQ